MCIDSFRSLFGVLRVKKVKKTRGLEHNVKVILKAMGYEVSEWIEVTKDGV